MKVVRINKKNHWLMLFLSDMTDNISVDLGWILLCHVEGAGGDIGKIGENDWCLKWFEGITVIQDLSSLTCDDGNFSTKRFRHRDSEKSQGRRVMYFSALSTATFLQSETFLFGRWCVEVPINISEKFKGMYVLYVLLIQALYHYLLAATNMSKSRSLNIFL